MIARTLGHVGHHFRFYLSALVGIVVWLAMTGFPPDLRAVTAGDAFFASYLVSVALAFMAATPKQLRERATSEDEGITLIVLITLFAVVISFYSIVTLLGYPQQPGALHLLLAVAGVPLGWLTFHTIMAFHYAHLYYGQVALDGGQHRDAGGLIFPGDDEPMAMDFLYYSFVVAMTAQVSDVQVCRTYMRRATLIHSIASFFFNTVILALAVSALAELTK
ncbi:MAG TPA: DUF1345 domain-containing protein [Alphaproteobacteria bacterium]|jgi:uncharacterized membrane protein|nr:DUF1345 domain-containing protein [Alphaproteobacteria bacterium]